MCPFFDRNKLAESKHVYVLPLTKRHCDGRGGGEFTRRRRKDGVQTMLPQTKYNIIKRAAHSV